MSAVRSALVIVVVLYILLQCTEGLSTRKGSHKFKCIHNDKCCKLGRKVARRHNISSAYLCNFEVLFAMYRHQSSFAKRLRANPGRAKYTKTLVHTPALRVRLSRCFPRKACFESCCRATKRALKSKPSRYVNARSHVPTTPMSTKTETPRI